MLIPERDGANGTGLMPLPFLLAVLNDAKTPAAIMLKVASATMPYTHPRQSTRLAKRCRPRSLWLHRRACAGKKASK